MKLPCDNITEFIDGVKRFYKVDEDKYKVGDTVTLFNSQYEHDFRVTNVFYWDGYVLTLKGLRYFLNDGNKQELPELEPLSYHWYSSKDNPPADKVAGGLYGFVEEPSYETIEQYDLRFVAYETWDKVTDRCF